MKILVDAREVHPLQAGIGRYIHNLFQELEEIECEYTFRAVVTKQGAPALPKLLKEKPLEISTNAVTRYLKPVVDNHVIPRYFKREKFQLFYAAGHFAPLFDNKVPMVATIHDLSPFLFPQAFPWHLCRYLKYSLKRIAAKAKIIATPSENTKLDLIRILKVKSDKIRVIYPSLIMPNINLSPDIKPVKLDKYLLTVGTKEPRKNIMRLIKAYAALEAELREEYPLVITGKMGWKPLEYEETVENAGLTKNVLFTGFIEDRMLPYLFSKATVFCYPSLYEGFGFPPLEAMYYGAPVLTSNVSSLPEVVGDAAVLVNPYSIESIADGIRKLLNNPGLRTELQTEGKVQAQKFIKNEFAVKMLEVFAEGLN